VNEYWYFFEGVILDKEYLTELQKQFSDCQTVFAVTEPIPVISKIPQQNGI